MPLADLDDDVPVVLERAQLGVGLERDGLLLAVDDAERCQRVGVGDRRAHVLDAEADGGQLHRD